MDLVSLMEVILLIFLLGCIAVLLHFKKRNFWLSRKNSILTRKLKRANQKLEAWQLGWDLEKQRFLEALSDAFLLINMQGQVLAANKRARMIFGNIALEGSLLTQYSYNEVLANEVKKALEAERCYTSTFSLGSRDVPFLEQVDGESWWHMDAAPVIGVDGCRRLIIKDITEQYRTEQVRKDFVANASHELRTPLTIIVGYLESLEEEDFFDSACEETGRKIIAIMHKHSLRLQRIVEDMLMISKLESAESAALKESWFDLDDCVEDVLDRLESIFESRRAKLVRNFPGKKLIVFGDRFYWIQIFFNLIENSLKQNSREGLVIEVGAVRDELEKTARIWVKDNGIGIPETHLPYIFKRFYRVEAGSKEIRGTGLGLSIVKRSVEAHNGLINVSSVPGEETRFLMSFPLGRLKMT